jgi:hypothetical protein
VRPPKIKKKKLKTGNLQQGGLDENVRFSDPEHIIYDLTDDSDGEEASAAQIVPYMSLPGADRAVSLAPSEPVSGTEEEDDDDESVIQSEVDARLNVLA